MTKLTIEKWGGTKVYSFKRGRTRVSKQGKVKVYVIRDSKKRLLQWKKVKGSGLSLHEARQLYRKNGTFSDKFHYNVQKFGKRITQKTKMYYNEKDVPKREKFGSGLVTAQYCMGTYGVNTAKKHDVSTDYGIFGRSNKIQGFGAKDIEKAKREASKRFYSLLDRYFTGRYDEDEGMEIAKQNNLKIVEGFVWYNRSAKRNSVRKARSR
jgi:hypothetical protein